jgi:hypothetical protein
MLAWNRGMSTSTSYQWWQRRCASSAVLSLAICPLTEALG